MGRVVFLVLLAMVPFACGAKENPTVKRISQKQMLLQLTETVNKLAANKDVTGGVSPVVMDNGYYMVFRLQAGTGTSAYDSFMGRGQNDDDVDPFVRSKMPCSCRTTNGSLPCGFHFRSKLLDHWEHLPIERVRVGVYEDNEEKRFWEFEAGNTNFYNWFRKEKLIGDSYNDLTRTAESNYFSVAGHEKDRRRFFVNKGYHGCGSDVGWLVVTEKANCDWERRTSAYPNILYSKTVDAVNWNSDDVGEADVMVISIKLNDEASTCPAN